jgi:hypothetical protein
MTGYDRNDLMLDGIGDANQTVEAGLARAC